MFGSADVESLFTPYSLFLWFNCRFSVPYVHLVSPGLWMVAIAAGVPRTTGIVLSADVADRNAKCEGVADRVDVMVITVCLMQLCIPLLCSLSARCAFLFCSRSADHVPGYCYYEVPNTTATASTTVVWSKPSLLRGIGVWCRGSMASS